MHYDVPRMRNETLIPEASVNPAPAGSVLGGVEAATLDTAATPLVERPHRRPVRQVSFGRSLTVSFALHAALVCAGVTGGASYARRSGALAREEGADEDFTAVSVVFSPTSRPRPTDPFV